MVDEVVIDGAYPELFRGYVSYKRAAGYGVSRNCQYPLRALSRFLAGKPPAPEVLSEGYVMEYCARRPSESASTQHARMSLCRQFALYLRGLGYACYVYPEQLVKRDSSFVPYIISEDEMYRIIRAADEEPYVSQSPDAHRVYPVLIRLLWSCGLRLSEALSLTVGDVDLDAATITVRKAKGGKCRLLPMSGSMADCLRRYWRIMCFDAADGCEWLFPSRGGGRRDRSPAGLHIKKIMLRAGVTVDGSKPPRVHDIRHSYAVRALERMDEGGVDARVGLPLLATYMGHADIQSTEYYLHFTEQARESVLGKMRGPYADVFPEVGDA